MIAGGGSTFLDLGFDLFFAFTSALVGGGGSLGNWGRGGREKGGEIEGGAQSR